MGSPQTNWHRRAWIGVGLLLGLFFLFVVYSFIGTVVFGIFIYYATRPVHRRLDDRLRYDSLSALIALVVLALPALVLFSLVVAVGVEQLSRLTRTIDPAVFGGLMGPMLELQASLSDPATLFDRLSGIDLGVVGQIQGVFGHVGRYLATFGNVLLHLFVMFALAFYLLRDGERGYHWFVEQFDDESQLLARYLRAVDTDFSSILFGNILNAVLTGLIGAIVYGLLNRLPHGSIPYPELLGLLTGVGSLIPVVGMKLVYVPVALLLAVQYGRTPGGAGFVIVFAVVSFVIVDTLPDFILRPYVSGRNLHIGMVMFAYILGPLLFGWYGIFLGPILLVLGFHFARIVLPELLGTEENEDSNQTQSDEAKEEPDGASG
ncbi:AI-2E family transporter [Halocatena halophila]|uniref:AI-2E family transporter n=1 Tax=Halocatena halophila TaxID=2814576 RepID=UPI002ED3E991